MSDIILNDSDSLNVLNKFLKYFISQNQMDKGEAETLYLSILDQDSDEVKIRKLLLFIRSHSRFVEDRYFRDKHLTITSFENQLKSSIADLSLYYEEELIDYGFVDLARLNIMFFWTSVLKFHYDLSDNIISSIVGVESITIRSISQISYSFLIGYVASSRRDNLVNIIKDSDFKRINEEMLIREDQKSLFNLTIDRLHSIIDEQNYLIKNMNEKILGMNKFLKNKIEN